MYAALDEVKELFKQYRIDTTDQKPSRHDSTISNVVMEPEYDHQYLYDLLKGEGYNVKYLNLG